MVSQTLHARGGPPKNCRKKQIPRKRRQILGKLTRKSDFVGQSDKKWNKDFVGPPLDLMFHET
ncbi:CLUMA_CG011562, isoform A [Clunio marinus]|uniref:CLUMA_CG011562, isoform A n=1 Tax=Clunio marinus TaxID=568069 RepID=A0A1J1ID40_9DIPT|nr:CLUMA_CG011562, isoform A [Clunio marinus]